MESIKWEGDVLARLRRPLGVYQYRYNALALSVGMEYL